MTLLRIIPVASILALAACEGMSPAPGPYVGDPTAVAGAGVTDQLCDRSDEPTGEIVNTGAGATAVIDTGAGPGNNVTNPQC
ncbi:hypothetical protein [Wenxinia marina]|uniref:Lipoprotein n=1 Tax=Wenxinia marina DSM 24838 TaxID=1123501 RepID=A0A0D0P835_9RHOB|nr:hypothetical protein [Wenxinia marina]KIQ67701.1 hypothetical protein Wenmar_03660 [Wenxinia marina DSM 24838]GGL77834.1 hypothetical protein GCM10011392_35460 [Wenxinia marina]